MRLQTAEPVHFPLPFAGIPMRTRALGLMLVTIVVGACADKVPARIDVSSTTIALYDRTPAPTSARLVNAGGESLVEPALSFSATPATVLSVTSDGQVGCLTTGDGTIVIAGGGQSATLTVSCKIVASIRAPSDARLILGRAPEPAPFVALSESGAEVANAPLEISSSNQQVARYESGALVSVGIGQATVTARRGAVSSSFAVSVVELIQSVPLALGDGESSTWTLQQGKYELDIEVKADGGYTYGVTVTWVGTDCPDAKESQRHHLFCAVAQTASLTVLNPTSLGLGPSAKGFMNLYRNSK